MAAKAKDKKGKKGKNKGEKSRQEVAAEVVLPPVVALPAKVSAPVNKTAIPTGASPATAATAPSTATSDAILDAAIECVATAGIEGLTTRRIAAQAGVNEVTIFRHFGSKDGLLDAVFAREAARMTSGAIQYSANLEGDLVRIVTTFRETLVRRAGVLPILLEVTRRKALSHAGGKGAALTFDDVTTVLDRYMKAGKLRSEPLAQALFALVGPLFLETLLAPIAGGSTMADAKTGFDAREHVRGFLHGRAAT